MFFYQSLFAPVPPSVFSPTNCFSKEEGKNKTSDNEVLKPEMVSTEKFSGFKNLNILCLKISFNVRKLSQTLKK